MLYRKRPEIIIDIPSQVNANLSPELWIIIRDANRFPLQIKSIELKIKNEKQKIISIKKDLNIFANEPFSFYSIVLDPLPAGTYEITPSVETIQKNHSKKWIRWNYLF